VRKFILDGCLYAGLLTSALAGTYKVPRDEPLAAVHIPQKWQTKEHDELLETASPDGSLRFLIVRPEANKITESMAEVMRYIRNNGGIKVNAESLKRDSGELNEMHVRHLSWEGQDKNGEVKIRFSVISIAEKRFLLAVFWGSPAAQMKYHAQLNRILKSIKKA
jgi:hypothetical protein